MFAIIVLTAPILLLSIVLFLEAKKFKELGLYVKASRKVSLFFYTLSFISFVLFLFVLYNLLGV